MRNIFKRVWTWVMVALVALPAFQSCKNDEGDFLKDVPSELTLKCGYSQQVIFVPDDVLMIPAILATMKWESDDNEIAVISEGEIVGNGVGETEIRILDADEKNVLKVCHVTVTPTVEIDLKPGETAVVEDLLDASFKSLSSVSSQNGAVAKVTRGYEGAKSYYLIEAVATGTTEVSCINSDRTRRAVIAVNVTE